MTLRELQSKRLGARKRATEARKNIAYWKKIKYDPYAIRVAEAELKSETATVKTLTDLIDKMKKS